MRTILALCLLLICGDRLVTTSPADPQEMPRVKKKVDPLYPNIFKLAGVEGQVEIRAYVSEEGKVEDAVSISATNENFIPAAIKAVKQWEFYPATKDGKPIKAEVVIPFVFRQGAGSYKAKLEDLFTVQRSVLNILQDHISDSLKSQVDPEAYAVVGNRYEYLYSLLFDTSKRGLLTEGRDSKVELSRTIVDDSEDSAFYVIKTLPARGKPERYHTIVLMKSGNGQWKIRAWHSSN